MRPYSIDLRQRVLDAYQAGEGSMKAIAARFDVSVGFIKNLRRLHATTGSLEPRPHRVGRPRAIDARGEAALLELLAERNDRILRELVTLLQERYAIRSSITSVHAALARMGVSRKKRRSTPANETA